MSLGATRYPVSERRGNLISAARAPATANQDDVIKKDDYFVAKWSGEGVGTVGQRVYNCLGVANGYLNTGLDWTKGQPGRVALWYLLNQKPKNFPAQSTFSENRH